MSIRKILTIQKSLLNKENINFLAWLAKSDVNIWDESREV